MLVIENITLTDRAASEFHRQRPALKAEPGEVFALVWVSSHTRPGGTTVPGFKPGYMCGPLFSRDLASPWALAKLPDGSRFYFMPRFEWQPDGHYVVDKRGALFSVGPDR